jgi:hypothetical protein
MTTYLISIHFYVIWLKHCRELSLVNGAHPVPEVIHHGELEFFLEQKKLQSYRAATSDALPQVRRIQTSGSRDKNIFDFTSYLEWATLRKKSLCVLNEISGVGI